MYPNQSQQNSQQYTFQTVDMNVSGPLYHQQPHSQHAASVNYASGPGGIVSTTYTQPYANVNVNNMPTYIHQQQQQQSVNYVAPEPLPNATGLQPTPVLTPYQLADFASSMVYLMWHARRPSVMALHTASSRNAQTSDLYANSQSDQQSRETATIANLTSRAFKKYCRQILHATQLSESVVMLSLKFIAMLLQKHPHIQGAEGSEYRLFTVALMLGNKFLDDNTFTNKTWSKVSGMNLNDLNVMEFEFLDVLDFQLFVRKDEFEQWKMALVNFRAQLENANMAEEYERQQQIIRATLQSVGVPVMDQQWTQGISQAQQQQQQYHQYLNLLSKAQQPQFPLQQINGPLARVPLRIPMLPVYANPSPQHHQPSSSSAAYNTSNVSQLVSSAGASVNAIQQQQQQQPFYPTNSLSNPPSTQSQATVHNNQQCQHYQPSSTAGSGYGVYNNLPQRPMSASSGGLDQYNHPVSYSSQQQPHPHVSRPRPSRALRVHTHQYAPMGAYAMQRIASTNALASASEPAYHPSATTAPQRHAYIPSNNAQRVTNNHADWYRNNDVGLPTPEHSTIAISPASVGTMTRSVTQGSLLNYDESGHPTLLDEQVAPNNPYKLSHPSRRVE